MLDEIIEKQFAEIVGDYQATVRKLRAERVVLIMALRMISASDPEPQGPGALAREAIGLVSGETEETWNRSA
jgi:hypothetical protein